MVIDSSMYFIGFFAFILILSCILMFLSQDLSLFLLALIGLSVTLFSLNICSIIGFCPKDVELIKYSKEQKKCIFKKHLFFMSILSGLLVIAFLFIFNRVYNLL